MLTKELWDRQLDFNRKFFMNTIGKDISKLTLEEKQVWTQKFLLHITKEISEVLDEINWKMHRKENKDVIFSNILEELTDNQKFLLGIYQIWGFTYDDYISEFKRKTFVVEQRYKQEHEIDLLCKDSKVCALDLDGVLCKYPEGFLNFVKEKFDIEYNDIYELKKRVGVKEYEHYKHIYRLSGEKQFLEPRSGASEFTQRLRKAGYKIVIITARPYEKYMRIYYDTLYWLEKNNIVYDAIFWDKDKCVKIVKELPSIEFLVEDDYNNALQVAEEGYKVYLMRTKYNKDTKSHFNIYRTNGLNSLMTLLKI